MTTAAFKIQYVQYRDALRSMGDHVPDPAEDVDIFLSKLDPVRFGSMRTALDNQSSLGHAKPATVDKAYDVAIAWKTSAASDNKRAYGHDNHQSIFVLSDEYRPSKVQNRGDGSRGSMAGRARGTDHGMGNSVGRGFGYGGGRGNGAGSGGAGGGRSDGTGNGRSPGAGAGRGPGTGARGIIFYFPDRSRL